MPENRKSSTAKKLIQAAALAAVLVPLGSVMVETSTISCGFGLSGAGSCTSGGTRSGNAATFDFHAFGADYLLSLDFAAIDHSFNLSVEDSLTDQGTLDGSGRLAAFPGHTCIPIADGTKKCVEFIFGNGAGGPPPEPGGGWHGLYDFGIFWDVDTNAGFPGTAGRIHVLHNSGVDGAPFNEDFCARFGCTYHPGGVDPGVDGSGDGFHSLLVTTAVPEPGSILLVATGVGALYNRRRRRRDADAQPPL